MSRGCRRVRFASADELARIRLAATPLESLLRDREDIVELVSADVGAALAPFVRDDGLAFPHEAHVALASV
jgi:hypothetical protein